MRCSHRHPAEEVLLVAILTTTVAVATAAGGGGGGGVSAECADVGEPADGKRSDARNDSASSFSSSHHRRSVHAPVRADLHLDGVSLSRSTLQELPR